MAQANVCDWLKSEQQKIEAMTVEYREEQDEAVNIEFQWMYSTIASVLMECNKHVTELLKTPKMFGGKTPRSVKTRNHMGMRQPLTDIFAPNKTAATPPFTTKTVVHNTNSPIRINADIDANIENHAPHEITRDHVAEQPATKQNTWPEMPPPNMTQSHPPPSDAESKSFWPSDLAQNTPIVETRPEAFGLAQEQSHDVEMEDAQTEEVATNNVQPERVQAEDLETHSDASSPEQPLNRKSSVTFSGLPAREPILNTKKSNKNMLSSAFKGFKGIFTTHSTSQEAPQTMKDGSSIKPAAERPGSSDSDKASRDESTKSTIPPAGKLRAPARLPREAPKAAPAPSIIRVAPQSQRLGQGPSRDASSRTVAPALAGNPRTVKALEAAARKKDADERAAAKKAEQKRELERKRAAKAMQEKIAEEKRKAAEAEREAAENQRLEQMMHTKLAAAQARQQDFRRREEERVERQNRQQDLIRQHQEDRRVQLERMRKVEEDKKVQLERMHTAAEDERVALERMRKAADIRQKQAAADKLEEQLEQAKREEADYKRTREAHALAENIKRERAAERAAQRAAQSHLQSHRSDVTGTLRHLGKAVMSVVPNGAKPASKRQLPVEENELFPQPVQRTGPMVAMSTYQQEAASKRRRTNEAEDEQMGGMDQPRASVRAPPKRPSTMRKETLSKANHGYSLAPPPAAHHAGSMYKSAMPGPVMQHAKHAAKNPSQLAQMSNARIPFAGTENMAPSKYQPAHGRDMYKTPSRPASHMVTKPTAPVSAGTPLVGDNIELPDIFTDSEDDDGEASFQIPSWARSPALGVHLKRQELDDPEAVFGPIGGFDLEEAFAGNKNTERLKRFRDRGSSALWVENRDAITSGEKARDRVLRRRLAEDGEWRYERHI